MKNKRFQKLPDYLSKEQQRDFLRVANKFHNTKNVFRKNNVLLCIKLQLYTGLRIQEVLNLTPNDVFLGENTNELKVVQGKGYKDRIVPLAAPVSEMLRFINSYLKPKFNRNDINTNLSI